MSRAFLVPVVLPADPANAMEAATKQYVDGKPSTLGGTSTDNAIVRFNGTGGTSLQDSVVTVGDTGKITVGASGTIIWNDGWLDVGGVLTTLGALRYKVTTLTGNTTLGDTHVVLKVDCTAGAVTVTLPTAATGAGKFYIIKKIDSTANAVTINTTSSQLVDGNASGSAAIKLNNQYDVIGVVSSSSSSDWLIVFRDTTPIWTAITRAGAWTDLGGTYQVSQYRKVGDEVQLRGVVTGGTGLITTLPSGFRPPKDSVWPVVANNAFGVIVLASTGTLTLAVGTGTNVDLSVIKFSVTA